MEDKLPINAFVILVSVVFIFFQSNIFAEPKNISCPNFLEPRKIDNVMKDLMERHYLSLETVLARWTSPEHIVGKVSDGVYQIGGTRDGVTTVFDGYNNDELIPSRTLPEPSVGATEGKPHERYERYGPLAIEFTLGDVILIGGKLYLDNGSEYGKWRITIPEGKFLTVKLIQGTEDLADRGAKYNSILSLWNGGGILTNLNNWDDRSTKIFTAYAYEKLSETSIPFRYKVNKNSIQVIQIDNLVLDPKGSNLSEIQRQILQSFLYRVQITEPTLNSIVNQIGNTIIY